MKKDFGKFIEELRGKMPLRKAAERSGLSHTYIRDLELGINRKTKAPINPTPETIMMLSKAYDYPYEELMKKAGYLKKDDTYITNGQGKNAALEAYTRLSQEKRKLIDDMIKALSNEKP